MSLLSIPQPPATVNAAALTPTKIRVSWAASAQADGYFVYRLVGSVWQKVSTNLVTGLFYDDQPLQPNTNYCYKVVACNKCGMSDLSSQVCATTPCETPLAPFGLTIVGLTSTTATIQWFASATTPIPRYVVKYGPTNPPLLTAPGSPTSYGANSFVVTGLSPSTTYCFQVFADNGCLLSTGSNVVCQATPCLTPDTVPSLSLTVISDRQINAVWSSAPNAQTYTLERWDAVNGWQVIQTGLTLTSYEDNTLTADTEYCYRVKGVNTCATGGYSPVACRTTFPTPVCDTPEQTFNWSVQRAPEPGFYPTGGNAASYISYSPVGSIDISNPLITQIGFGAATDLDDILIMYHDTDDVVQNYITGPNPDGSGITEYVIPSNAIIFGNTFGFYVNGPFSGANCSSEKRFSQPDRGINVVMPSGCAPGAPGIYTFADFAAAGFETAEFADGITKQRLIDLGFVDGNGIFRFKFAHIICGIGHAYIRSMTCETASSSSSAISSSSSSSSSSGGPCVTGSCNCACFYTVSMFDGINYQIYNFAGDGCGVWQSGNSIISVFNGKWRMMLDIIGDPSGGCFVQFEAPCSGGCPPTNFDAWTLITNACEGQYEIASISTSPCVSSSSSGIGCNYVQNAAGGNEGFEGTYNLSSIFPVGVTSREICFFWQSYSVPDELYVKQTNSSGTVLVHDACRGTINEVKYTFTLNSSDPVIYVQVIPNCTGTNNTGWYWRIECECNAHSSSSSCQPLLPARHFIFEDLSSSSSSSNTTKDVAPCHVDGIIKGLGTIVNYDVGKVGLCLDFEAPSHTDAHGRVESDGSCIVNGAAGRTVAMWVKPGNFSGSWYSEGSYRSGFDPDETGTYDNLSDRDFQIECPTWTSPTQYGIRVNIWSVDTDPGSGFGLYSKQKNNLSGWTHVAAVLRSDSSGWHAEVYYNGVLFDSTLVDRNTFPQPPKIFLGAGVVGHLDDFRLYNQGLTAGQISALYNGGAGTQDDIMNTDSGICDGISSSSSVSSSSSSSPSSSSSSSPSSSSSAAPSSSSSAAPSSSSSAAPSSSSAAPSSSSAADSSSSAQDSSSTDGGSSSTNGSSGGGVGNL